MKFLGGVTSLAVMMLGIGVAQGQEQGWYVSGGLGAIGMDDSNVSHTPPPAQSYKIGHEINGVMQASIGFTLDQFRIEDELSYSNIQHNPWSPLGHTAIGADLINVLWNVPVNDRWTFDVGAGVGVAQVTQTYANTLSGTKTDLAWQGILGASYWMAPGSEWFMDYHHRETTGNRNYVSPNASLNPSTVSHVVSDLGVMGVRWYFEP